MYIILNQMLLIFIGFDERIDRRDYENHPRNHQRERQRYLSSQVHEVHSAYISLPISLSLFSYPPISPFLSSYLSIPLSLSLSLSICIYIVKIIYFFSTYRCVKKVYHSDSNFVLIQVENSQEIMRKTKEKNIIIRDRSRVREKEIERNKFYMMHIEIKIEFLTSNFKLFSTLSMKYTKGID